MLDAGSAYGDIVGELNFRPQTSMSAFSNVPLQRTLLRCYVSAWSHPPCWLDFLSPNISLSFNNVRDVTNYYFDYPA